MHSSVQMPRVLSCRMQRWWIVISYVYISFFNLSDVKYYVQLISLVNYTCIIINSIQHFNFIITIYLFNFYYLNTLISCGLIKTCNFPVKTRLDSELNFHFCYTLITWAQAKPIKIYNFHFHFLLIACSLACLLTNQTTLLLDVLTLFWYASTQIHICNCNNWYENLILLFSVR